MVEWRSIKKAPGYQVSDTGLIRSPTGVLKQYHNKYGYRICLVVIEGRVKTFVVHTEVAGAFLGPRPNGHQVSHEDHDKNNNAVVNLRWRTPASNCGKTIADGRRHSQRGSSNNASKLTESDIPRIMSELKRGAKLKELASEYGVSFQTISDVKRRKLWGFVDA